MAEVGVLNLTIKDNSNEAAAGLNELAGALSSVRSNASGGIGLAGIRAELTSFTRSINAAKTTNTVFQNIAAFGKGLADVARVVKASQTDFDTSKIVGAIENIKAAVGEGMHLGTAGTQIKNIREALTGEWKTDNAYQAGIALSAIGEGAKSMDGASLGTKAKGISAVAKAISEYADAATKVQTALNIGQATIDIGQNITTGAAQGMESQKSAVEQAAVQIGNAIINAIRDTLGIHSPSKVTEEQGRFAGIGLANGLIAVKNEVQSAAGAVADTIQQTIYSKLNLMNYANSPVQNLLDAFRPGTAAVNEYKNAVNAVLPKVQEMSSEEMLIAGNARMATEAIKNLIARLDTIPNPKGKGFSEYVDAVTGVTRGNAAPLINENTTMFKPIDWAAEQMEKVQASTEGASASIEKADTAAGALAENTKAVAESMDRVASDVQEGISLMDIPASGKNGAFANAAEEMKYLTEQIEKAKLAQQQFSDIEAKAAKQLKYGGPMKKDELEFNLRHATEGYYKAVEAADTYKAALEELKTYAANAAAEIKKTTAAAAETPAARGVGSIKGIYDDVRFGPTLAGKNGAEEQMALIQDMARGTGLSIEEIKRQLTELSHGTIQFGDNVKAAADQAAAGAERVAQSVDNAKESANSAGQTKVSFLPIDTFIKEYSHIEYLKNKIEELKALLDSRRKIGIINPDEIDSSVMKIRSLTDEVKKLQEEADKSGSAFSALKAGIQKTFPTITGLVKRFQSMAKKQAIRYLIRQLTAGISEGLKNVYFYSKEVGTSFAPAMDSAASSLAQMKNSVGAALAPAVQALIPVLQTVMNWFINLMNVVNQFFALLGGQKSWTRALLTDTEAFEDKTKKAKGAAKEMKDLLADWDELNIIQSESGGGGSGSGQEAVNYTEMFEQVHSFDKRIRDVVSFIQDHFEQIRDIALLIGSTILLWKLSNGFAAALPLLSKIAGAAAILGTVVISLALTDLFGKQFAKTGEPGWFIADALSGAFGATIAGKMATKIAGGAAGLVVAGTTLTLASMVNIKNALGAFAQKQVARWGMLTILSAVEGGVGAALIAKGIGLTTAFSFGLGAMAAIGAVAISVGAAIQMSKDNIEWGDISLTDEEVAEFVQARMFTGVPVQATVDLINVTVDKVSASKDDIEKSVADILPTLHTLKLGIDKEASYEELKKQILGDEEAGVKGLVSKIEDYTTANIQELKVAFSVVPVIDKTGQDVSAQYLQSGITGWETVNEYMKGLGDQLGKELSKGFTEDGLAKFDEDAVKAITEKMANISRIITGSQIESEAQGDLSLGLGELALKDLDHDSVNKVVGLYGTYREKLTEEYTKIYKDAAGQYLILARFYAEQGDKELAKLYQDQYDQLMKDMPYSVATAVENASGAGRDMIYKFLQENFGDAIEKFRQNTENGGTGAWNQWLVANFTPTQGDFQKSAKDLNAALADWFGGENMFLGELLHNMPGLNIWGLLSEEMRDNLYGIIKEKYGQEFADEIVRIYAPSARKAGETVIEELKEGYLSGAKIGAEGSKGIFGAYIDQLALLDDALTVYAERYGKKADELFAELSDWMFEGILENNGRGNEQTVFDAPALDDSQLQASLETMQTNVDDTVQHVKDSLGELGDTSASVNLGMNGAKMPVRTMAAGAGATSGVRFVDRSPVEGYATPGIVYNENMEADVEKGVRNANTEQNDLIRQLITLATRIANKEMVVNVAPTSSWGQHNARSAEAFNRISGSFG